MKESIPVTRPIVVPVVRPFLTTRRHGSPWFPVRVEVLGFVDLVGLDDTECLEETVLWVLVVGLVLRVGEHDLAVLQRREVTSYRGI